MEKYKTPEWMQDELVKDIPKEKLQLLQEMFVEADTRAKKAGSGSSQKEMLMAFMPLLKKAKEKNLSFSPKEMQAAIAAIRKYSTPEELNQIDSVYSKLGKPKQ